MYRIVRDYLMLFILSFPLVSFLGRLVDGSAGGRHGRLELGVRGRKEAS